MNTSTGYSPFELLYGHNAKLPNEISSRKYPTYNYDNYAHELRGKLKTYHDMARENIIERKEQNKKHYDSRVKTKALHLKTNDLVLIFKQKKDSKFDAPYEGPYRVERMLSPVTVLIKRNNKSIRVHVDKIKLARADYGDKTPPPIE